MFVTFEGIDGCGKTTLATLLSERLAELGERVLLTREPGGSVLGKRLRDILIKNELPLCDEAEIFLFLADRAQHIHEVILPALKDGVRVVCDRFSDSTLAYQGYGRAAEPDRLRNLLNFIKLKPDATFLLDLPPEVARKRIFARGGNDERFDRRSPAYFAAVRSGFLRIAREEPERVTVLDALLPPNELLSRVASALKLES